MGKVNQSGFLLLSKCKIYLNLKEVSYIFFTVVEALYKNNNKSNFFTVYQVLVVYSFLKNVFVSVLYGKVVSSLPAWLVVPFSLTMLTAIVFI